MVTFNVDSLDFSDGEAIRTGADDDFSTRYSSSNDRLEIEDLTNATVGHIPRDTGTDLVGGKFAETLSEGEALADNGEVYESIQEAVNNASSFVRVGPGEFRESVTIDTEGLTLQGSGRRTHITSQGIPIEVTVSDVTLHNFSFTSITSDGVVANGSASGLIAQDIVARRVDTEAFSIDGGDSIVANCTVKQAEGFNGRGIRFRGTNSVAVGNTIRNVRIIGIQNDADDNIVAYNNIKFIGRQGIQSQEANGVIIGNRVDECGGQGFGEAGGGIGMIGTDEICANNRVSNTTGTAVRDSGTGTVLDGNLTT